MNPRLPAATYRLQFRAGMDFERAASIVPYLRDLGISHLYASPLFQAVTGSTHGYDVTDHGRFDEALGGFDGFLALSDALGAAGLGLILDIVPNHMAASVENPWWRDVLKNGAASRFAGHFDIDWSAPKLILPILGRPYGAVLDAGEFSLGREPDGYALRYFEHAVPLSPAAGAVIADAADTDAPDGAVLARLSRDRDLVHRIHEAQNWRLAYWRLARDGLTNRRFFEISDLVGVRVEEPRVFDDVHAFLFEMIESGRVDGVRIDHIDGLADPAGYLDRLAGALPRPVPVWVEKILAHGEHLPDGWPVAGTTGYEFADLASAILIDAAGIAALSEGYDAFTGAAHDHDEMRVAAKHEILAQNLATERAILTDHAEAALADDPYGRDWGHDSLRRALTALLAGMPVYRTYLDGSAPSAGDRAVLDRARDAALAQAELDDPAVIEAVLRHIVHGQTAADARLRTRFQQTAGALMAKAVEDTLFYRYNRLISANEVGGAPDVPALSAAVFHEEMARRARLAPAALSATATHDTKRGEDARARIAAITELPHVWLGAVAAFDRALGGAAASVDAETRWLFYQGLLGAWETPADARLRDRTKSWLEKAAREAKLRTSWTAPDEDYERTLRGFVDAAFETPGFIDLFDDLAAPFVAIGWRKSLVQLALKLTAPGIPDIYQGTEASDLSYVDPDNRRPPDFDALRARQDDITARWPEFAATGAPDANEPSAEAPGHAKHAMLRWGLQLRRSQPDLFENATCAPVPFAGDLRLIAFRREGADASLFVVADLSGRRQAGAAPEGMPATRPVAAFPPDADRTTGPDRLAAALARFSVFIGLYGR